MLTVKQAAQCLAVSEQTVYALCASRRLRHHRIGGGRGVIRISEEAVAEYLVAQEVGPERPAPPPRPKVKFEHLRLN